MHRPVSGQGRVCVLGAGSWGTTLACLTAASHPTVLWARDPDVASEIELRRTNRRYLGDHCLPASLRASSDLADCVAGSAWVLVGVPSDGFREVLRAGAADLGVGVPVVSIAKGFEGGTLMRMTEVISEVLPRNPAAVLSGPNLAGEILAGQAAASVVACSAPGVALELQDLLGGGFFRVYLNHDVTGVEVGGALKNVIAIAAGIGEGLGAGDNSRAAVMARGLAEVTRLGVAMGAEATTFAGLAGLGDLLATCMSPLSRNRQVGLGLGSGRALEEVLASMTEVAEGVHTARLVVDLARRHRVDMPICAQIEGVVTSRISVAQAYRSLLSVPAGHEQEPY